MLKTKWVLVLVLVLMGTVMSGCGAGEISREELSAEKQELKQRLSDMQYQVTQEDATEPPFKNEYWDHHEAGLYVDVVSGEPLFSSVEKFDSNTGWPSFTQPVNEDAIKYIEDNKLGYKRVEVRSNETDSHLGHLFDDGPPPTNNRYCINSASLRFVPRSELESQGYGKYLSLFEES